jgi:hypothetical protein
MKITTLFVSKGVLLSLTVDRKLGEVRQDCPARAATTRLTE